ncbi:hypothetical protein MSPP1_000196 [Malassezia sp. CBS 17886]|nr:hypothetical protein MSPP1_000196 [Malassezia sp. CBS 17886]
MESGPHSRSYGVGKKFSAPASHAADAAPSPGARRDLGAAPRVPSEAGATLANGVLGVGNGLASSLAAPNVHIMDGTRGRVVCVADVRGNLRQLNQIAAETKASAIVHTGDFGFFTHDSPSRMSDRTLRHAVQHAPLLSPKLRALLLDSSEPGARLRGGPTPLHQSFAAHPEAVLSELPQFLAGTQTLRVPVFTVWGACEDVHVIERFRTGEYSVPNLYVLDESATQAVDIGGVRLRLLGLGGALVMHKLFDNGLGSGTIAGGLGAMWTTMLQIGELLETAQQVYDPGETRVFVTYASPGRDALLAQLALALRADITVSAGLHLRHVSSYNDFGVHGGLDAFRAKLLAAKTQFDEVWDAVKSHVEAAIDPSQRTLLNNAVAVALRVPQPFVAGVSQEESAWKNTWHWNLPDVGGGHLVLDIAGGRIGAETRSQGISFAHRRAKPVSVPKSQVVFPNVRPAQPLPPRALPAASAVHLPPPSAHENVLFFGHFGDASPVSEKDVRAYFGAHADNITQVHFFPADGARRTGAKDDGKDDSRYRKYVHVVFGTNAAAHAALSCRGRTIKSTDVVPTLEPLSRQRGANDRSKDRRLPKLPAEAPDESAAGRQRGGPAVDPKPSDGNSAESKPAEPKPAEKSA